MPIFAWFPNGYPDDLTPEEWQFIIEIRDRMLAREVQEHLIREFDYLMGLDRHVPGVCELGVN